MIRIIKRYESRKLYDTEESRYVSLEDIAKWVRDGQEVKVIDNSKVVDDKMVARALGSGRSEVGDERHSSSGDVTAQILTQIILDEGKRGTSFLPTELLHELVRTGEKAVSTGVERVQGKVDRLVQASIDRLGPVRRAREEMSHLRGRLAELEKTLTTLETENVARQQTAAKKPARKATTRKATTRKATTRKAATRKAATPKTKVRKAAD